MKTYYDLLDNRTRGFYTDENCYHFPFAGEQSDPYALLQINMNGRAKTIRRPIHQVSGTDAGENVSYSTCTEDQTVCITQ